MKKKMKIKNFLVLPLLLSIFLLLGSFNLPLYTENNKCLNDKTFNIRTSDLDFTNATVISDGIQGIIWNDGDSRDPKIALDHSGNIHVVWEDVTFGTWGSDWEIMYSNYSTSTGWSFPKVISDGYNNIFWNDGWSIGPDIAIDSSGNIHVVWLDGTEGIWGGGEGSDDEIMYVSYSSATGWSNATVISDGFNNIYWNDDRSIQPAIAIANNDNIHVVWSDNTDDEVWGYDWEIMHVTYTTATGWSNATIVSDGYNNVYWNDDSSGNPAIAIDNSNKVHIVWEDSTNGIWGTDDEIMYSSYTTATGWSNATLISDGHNNIYWNDAWSERPDIAVDSSGTVHVVWEDNTDGAWGSDTEIMYTSYTSSSGWSLPIVVSDGYNDIFWNNGDSKDPSISINPRDKIYVAWEDDTDGAWGSDWEIMCANYTEGDGWSNAVVISDGAGGIYWNVGSSGNPSIVADLNKVHVVWQDDTDGIWGVDEEIMYTSITIPIVAGAKGIPFGNFHLLFTFITILGLVIYLKKKSKL